MSKLKFLSKGTSEIIFGRESETNKFPLLNKITVLYIGVTVLVQIFFLIAPFISLIASTPLYSIKTYLGILGAALLCVDVFTNKVVWRGKYVYLLFGICVCAAISTITTVQYGFKDNIFDLVWVTIQFALVYSCSYRLNKEGMEKFVRILFRIINTVWTVACIVSIIQYAIQKGYRYIADPNTTNPEPVRQGFLDHRLFGVFTSLDYAAYISLILIIVAVYYIIKSKNIIERIALVISSLSYLLYAILSGSRSVMIAFIAYTFFFSMLAAKNLLTTKFKLRKAIYTIIISIISASVCFSCFSVLKESLNYVPYLLNIADTSDNNNNPNGFDSDFEDLEGELQNNNFLDRETPEDDISNDRFKIWKDYLSIHKEIGLFGLSLSNYNDYIKDNHPKLYIVKHFKQYSNSEKNDMVYESHNNYIFVFASTGYVGLALFLVFALIIVVKTLYHIFKSRYVSWGCITATSIVGVGCIEALFMNSVFLKLNGPSFVFWFTLGILVKIISESSERKKESI